MLFQLRWVSCSTRGRVFIAPQRLIIKHKNDDCKAQNIAVVCAVVHETIQAMSRRVYASKYIVVCEISS